MGELVPYPGFIPNKLSSGGGGGSMESRVAKLESDVGHIKSDITDIKSDIRDLRKDTQKDFRILVGFHVTTLLGIVGLLIKIFS